MAMNELDSKGLGFFLVLNKEIVQFPVNPQEIDIKAGSNNETFEVLNLGETTFLKNPKLKEYSFEGFFPRNSGAHYIRTNAQFKDPVFYIDFINRAKEQRLPIRFVITRTSIDTYATVEDFNYSMEGGTDDVNFSILLKEYKNASVIELKNVTENNNGIAKANKKQTKRTKTGFSVGDEVIVNGQYFYSSYGAKPSYNFNNFRGRISHIVADKSRKYRYHITTISGGYRGWVKEEQLRHV